MNAEKRKGHRRETNTRAIFYRIGNGATGVLQEAHMIRSTEGRVNRTKGWDKRDRKESRARLIKGYFPGKEGKPGTK